MTKNKEFNLSERGIMDDDPEIEEWFTKSDVKEFIKRLKEEIKARDVPVSGIMEELDKLAGDKLT